MEDLAPAFTSHYPSTAHPVLHRNNRKRTEQQEQREIKESFSEAGLWRMLMDEGERKMSVGHEMQIAWPNPEKALGFSVAVCCRAKV